MTTLLIQIQQLLESDNIEAAMNEAAKILSSFKTANHNIKSFTALLALGSHQALEVGLGVLGRKLLNKKQDVEVNFEIIWLFLAAVLSRHDIPASSPARVSILVLASEVDWNSPIFALFAPVFDSFLNVSLSQGNPLIAEQTLDFLATYGEEYAQAPHIKEQLTELHTIVLQRLGEVDEPDLQEEWSEGFDLFLKTARKVKYTNENIWSESQVCLKKLYPMQYSKNMTDFEEDLKVKEKISRLITTSLAALETIERKRGLSLAIHIDKNNNDSWSIIANIISKLEQFIQEVADSIEICIPKLFPARAVPGSYIAIFHIDLGVTQSDLFAQAISSLSLEYKPDSKEAISVMNSWREYAALLKEGNTRVDLAVSTPSPQLNIVQSLSTVDVDVSEMESSLREYSRVLSRDVPQASNFQRVLDFASLLAQYPSSLPQVRQDFLEKEGITDRQFSYYRRAVQILGLADELGQPTTACHTLNRLSSKDAKLKFLSYQFISSKVGLALLNWQNVDKLSEIECERERLVQFLIEVSPSLSEETANRRAQTLESWLKLFIEHWRSNPPAISAES